MNLSGLSALLAFALLVGTLGSQDVEPGQPLSVFAAFLEKRIPELLDEYDVPGAAVALVGGSEVAWSAAYGLADREGSRPMPVDAVFRTESISKSLTAWGVLRLVEQDKVGLDEPVGTYLSGWSIPGAERFDRAMTVRMLLTHTAGLPLGTIGVRYPPGPDVPSLSEDLGRQDASSGSPAPPFSTRTSATTCWSCSSNASLGEHSRTTCTTRCSSRSG